MAEMIIEDETSESIYECFRNMSGVAAAIAV